MILDILYKIGAGQAYIILCQDDGSLDNLTPDIVGYGGDGTFDHGRMGKAGTLDLKRADTVTRRLYDVVLAADEPQIAVGVAPGDIPRMIDSVMPGFGGKRLVVKILPEKS